ncbi:MAG: dephospho-CoA kinase [Ruminococcus sp.]|jgi:dephospho-CoA kinase|nr:dephospho-CoA kinase [Ruminococcus sp.]
MTQLIGLTGQSGAGKSLVSDIFRQNGFAVVDADLCSREAVEPGSKCLTEIAEIFGEKVINSDKTLNRKVLAEIVFSDKSELKKLNTVMHPFILDIVCKKIRELQNKGYKFIILDAPTLFESKADDICDLIISVTAKEDIRKKRISERDGISEENIEKRFKSQNSEDFFIKNSNYIIKNNSSIDELREKTEKIAEKIQKG